MAAKIAKYVILSIVGLLIVIGIAIAVIDDEMIEASAGPLAGPLLAAKHSVAHGLSGITNTIGTESTNTTPRVVQALPPPPAPSALAKPVQTRSLAEVAVETQQEYARRDADAGAMVGTDTPMTAPEPMAAPEPNTMAIDTPPPPPMVRDESVIPPSMPDNNPPAAPETMMAMQTTPDAMPAAIPASESSPEEMALLEGLTEQPSDDVAALPPEAPETETPESAVDEVADPNGEQAYAEGLKYYSGKGEDRNFGKAAQYFMKASERGHAEAQYSLGLMNYVGQTGGQDFTNAAKWFQLAAESGHVQAQYTLGFLYYEGKGVGQDLKTAYGWIDRAAKQGYAKAVKARDALQKAMPEMFGS